MTITIGAEIRVAIGDVISLQGEQFYVFKIEPLEYEGRQWQRLHVTPRVKLNPGSRHSKPKACPERRSNACTTSLNHQQ